jgi:hypothetical protein
VKKDGSQEKSSEEEKGKEACKEEKEIKSLHTRTQNVGWGSNSPASP